MKISHCTNCGSRNQYQSEPVSAGGGHAPNYLPGLGGYFKAEKFRIVICRQCGLTRFFAREEALEKLGQSEKWRAV